MLSFFLFEQRLSDVDTLGMAGKLVVPQTCLLDQAFFSIFVSARLYQHGFIKELKR
jgi:hypothetical protein